MLFSWLDRKKIIQVPISDGAQILGYLSVTRAEWKEFQKQKTLDMAPGMAGHMHMTEACTKWAVPGLRMPVTDPNFRHLQVVADWASWCVSYVAPSRD